jgi:lactoylglutathione lyase
MIKRLAHLAFDTDNTEQLLAFYTDSLGLRIQFTMNLEDGTEFGWYVACGETTFIEIFDRVGKSKMWGGSPQTPVAGNIYTHFCLEVDNLREYRDQLIGKGIKVTDISTGMDNSIQAWCEDPDGNKIELMEYTARSKQLL